MPRIDPFTCRRLTQFVERHRASTGQLPTLQDFEKGGFARALVDQAVREELLDQVYMNLQSGPMVKGYRVKVKDIV
jgi:hypothetical protein